MQVKKKNIRASIFRKLKCLFYGFMILNTAAAQNCGQINWYSPSPSTTAHSYMYINPDQMILTLMYHDIVRTPQEVTPNGGDVLFSNFKEQLNLILSSCFSSISMEDYYHKVFNAQSISGLHFMLTFDDGYSGNCSPELIQYLVENNIHATFFVHTRYVGVQDSVKSRCSYADWQWVLNHNTPTKKLFSVQSHTVSHNPLQQMVGNYSEFPLPENINETCESYKTWPIHQAKYMDLELFCSRNEIENHLTDLTTGCPQTVTFLAYPVGGYDQRILQDMQLFYGMGFTVQKPSHDGVTNYTIPRFGVGPSLYNLDLFAQELNAWLDDLQ